MRHEWTDDLDFLRFAAEDDARGFRLLADLPERPWHEMPIDYKIPGIFIKEFFRLAEEVASLKVRVLTIGPESAITEREAVVRYLLARLEALDNDIAGLALRTAAEMIRDEIAHHATLQEAQGPDSATPAASADGERWAWVGREKITTFEEGGIRFVTLQDARTALTAEREAIVRYLDVAAEANRRAGRKNTWAAIELLARSIERGRHHATLQEAQGPDSATPAASADSCDRNGGTDSSPETSG